VTDNELPCEFCGNPVELSDYHIYRQATGDGICPDCYAHEMTVKGHKDWDKRVELAEALEEADDLADYIEGQYIDLRCKELDIQHDTEGGSDG
jgi:hypothetical protein